MNKHMLVVCIVFVTASSFTESHAVEGATNNSEEISLRVQAVRLSRSVERNFGSRYYGDNSPGVSLHLLLKLKRGVLLPLGREAIVIETFIDDTYQNLLGPNAALYGGQQPALSDDGTALLFNVAGSRPPSDDAGRIFVRGKVEARAARGEAKVQTTKLPLIVGQGVMVGPFRTTLRAISDAGEGMSLTLAVYEDVGRVLKIRALDEAGKLLNDTRQTGFTDSTSRPRTLYLSLRQPIKDAVSLEYTFAEDTEQVAIPFEAQVDIGVAKAGPIEVLGAKARGGSSSPLERPWPPPPKAGTNQVLPPSRAAFVPSAEPNRVSSKNKNITVDLFSLTVGKSPPNELSATRWNNPPSPALQAAGFTIARLMLSAPGATIISVPPDGVTITKFEDDKGTKLSTVVFRDQTQATGYSRRSPDGQQSVVNVSLAAAPTPGATKCTIAGYLEARLAREERVIVAEKGELRKGARFDAGPFRIEVTQLRQVPPETPATSDVGAIEAWFGLYGPVGKVRLVEIADTRSEKVLGSRVITTPTPASDNVGFPVRLNTAPEGSVIVRVRYYDSDEIVRVPFDVTTGIGL